jgi:hypothetical protein
VARPPARLRLALRGLRTIGSAGTLSLAGVLASVLLIAAALSFAVVLSLAGVLGELLAICSQRTGDDRRGARVTGEWLSVETGGGAAEETGERCCHSEIAYCAGFHEEFLSSVRSGDAPEVFGFDLLQLGGKNGD